MDYYKNETGGPADFYGMNIPESGSGIQNMQQYPAGSAAPYSQYSDMMGGGNAEIPNENLMANVPQNIQSYSQMDPAQALSPEMQQFMEQGYLMGPNCFGRESQRYANQLVEFINGESADSQYYLILSRRAPTANARRIFRNLSNDELRHSRRWAAAYFLITGQRYTPSRSGQVMVPSNYAQALRDRYIAESADAVKYRQFAAGVSDRCLKRMALDTSDDERQHAQELLQLIQSM